MNLLAERISLQAQHSLKTTNQLLLFGKPTKELSTNMKNSEKCLDSQLWHACAGGMVQMPSVNSRVYYFPQGHAEHAQTLVDFGNSPKIPPFVLSRITSVKFLADPDTDEVFAKIRLVPMRQNELDFGEDEGIGLNCNGPSELQEKPASFAKTLTQSDANNGGGFSVPRYCAETIFPRLDYSADPPVQTVLAKDVHGEIWKFRHIYRGTPRRHLLTTGWSTFVNQKKLVAGDSIVFLRSENGDLCVGIRRAKRGIGGGPGQPSGWNPPAYGGLSAFLREEENKLIRDGGSMRGKNRIRCEMVIEAARLAASGQPFEVVYYPRASTPEFCVKAAAVRTAMRVQWCPGMRFKMAFETEDSSRISWFMGSISSVQATDPVRWPNSPWRLLQVTWDEPDLLQNVKCVNPWLVELVSSMPAIHLTPFSPPRKKLRIPDFPPENPLYSTTLHGPTGIQGARHAHYSSISLSDLQFNKFQPGLFHSGLHRTPDRTTISAPAKFSLFHNNHPSTDDDLSCLLSIGSPATNKTCNNGKKMTQLVLFGQPILTEEQISLSSSGNCSSDVNNEKGVNFSSSDESASGIHHHQEDGLGLETGPCKVFMESDDVGRSLDLSDFGSYEELCGRLAGMFGIAKSELMTRLIYHDAAGGVKHGGDAPFSEFMKTARRLTILMDSGRDDLGS